MIAIPAIDIYQGQCVRLKQGDLRAVTQYGDPVSWARRWVDMGAQRLHVVDLDGAFAGCPKSLGVVERICSINPSVSVQLGGGLRSVKHIESAFDSGAGYAIVGTAALVPELLGEASQRFGKRLMVAVDVQHSTVRVGGWMSTGGNVETFVDAALRENVSTAIVTAVSRDGLLCGPDLALTDRVARLGLNVIVSGGIGSLADLSALISASIGGVIGAILGRSLYDGIIDLRQAMDMLEKRRSHDAR